MTSLSSDAGEDGVHDNAKIPRVLYISHARDLGGAEVYLQQLIAFVVSQHSRQDGWTAELVCRTDRVLDPWVERLEADGARIRRLDLRGGRDVLSFRALLNHCDVVHLNLSYPVGKYQLLAAVLTRLAGVPLVVTHHLAIDLDQIQMSPLRRMLWRRAVRWYGTLARRNIVLSSAARELMMRTYGYPEANTTLIYNGVDLSRCRPLQASEREAVRAHIGSTVFSGGWSEPVVLVITVARLNIQKGLFDLLEAAALVRERHPQARFLIVGDGELRKDLDGRAAAVGLSQTVAFAGNRAPGEVASWLGAADIFALASHFEGMPFSLIEAIAAGCSVVATRVGGVPDVVEDSGAALIVPPKQPQQLADALSELISHPEQRATMSAAARRRAEGRFDIQRSHRATVALYERRP